MDIISLELSISSHLKDVGSNSYEACTISSTTSSQSLLVELFEEDKKLKVDSTILKNEIKETRNSLQLHLNQCKNQSGSPIRNRFLLFSGPFLPYNDCNCNVIST